MTAREPVFELILLDGLLIHEEIEGAPLEQLVAQIRREGAIRDPIWVARGSSVVLNGHHRVAALRALGAARAPAWLLDYDDPRIRLERWGPGPPVRKEEVLARAQSRAPFPPKTTRHQLDFDLPEHPTPLSALGGAFAPPAHHVRPSASRH
ncbi:MAG: ParB N-terminal domain-containing protein [Thermoplasmata archaeon]